MRAGWTRPTTAKAMTMSAWESIVSWCMQNGACARVCLRVVRVGGSSLRVLWRPCSTEIVPADVADENRDREWAGRPSESTVDRGKVADTVSARPAKKSVRAVTMFEI